MTTMMCQLLIREGMEKAYEELQRKMYEPTINGEHNRLYHTFRTENPREYFCLMSFDDYAAFIRHETSPHHEMVDWFVYIEDIKFHWLEPLEGASSLTAHTDYQVIRNPTPLEQKYISLFQIKRADWWPKTEPLPAV